MNYEQYHQKGGFYAIPVEIFDGLCEEKDELQKENQKLKEKLQNISNEFLKYDWKTSNKEQIINQLENLYNSIFRE